MIEPVIVALLSPLFGGRVFPDTAPAATPRPFCIYQQVGGKPSAVLCGNTTQQNARIQFVVWCAPSPAGGGRQQANTLMRQAEALLTEPPVRAVSQGSLVALWDEPTQTYGARQDFSFWM